MRSGIQDILVTMNYSKLEIEGRIIMDKTKIQNAKKLKIFEFKSLKLVKIVNF